MNHLPMAKLHCKFHSLYIDDELFCKYHMHNTYNKLIKFVGIFYKLGYALNCP